MDDCQAIVKSATGTGIANRGNGGLDAGGAETAGARQALGMELGVGVAQASRTRRIGWFMRVPRRTWIWLGTAWVEVGELEIR